MREIKFRALNIKHTDWIYFNLKYLWNCAKKWLKIDWKTTQQYTGLKDKNGKEIYEGDIITNYELRAEHIGEKNREIIWYDDYCSLAIATLSEDGKEQFISNIADCAETLKTDYEVIGNIWENSNLMK